MNLYLFEKNKISTFALPSKYIGNFWMTNSKGDNVVNIGAHDNSWVISGGDTTKIYLNNSVFASLTLQLKNYYLIEKDAEKYILLAINNLDNTFNTYLVGDTVTLKVGNTNDSNIYTNIPYFKNSFFTLNYNNSVWTLVNPNGLRIYNNNNLMVWDAVLQNGDVINFYGLRIILSFKVVIINNLFGDLRVTNELSITNLNSMDEITQEEIQNIPRYKNENYFLRSPRLRRSIKTLQMRIDSPPQRENFQEMPLIYTLGPMLTMGASSAITLINSMSQLGGGEKTLKQVLPTIVISIAMLTSMLVWPFLTRMYEKRRKKKKEKERQIRYSNYLAKKEKELSSEYNNQIDILNENLLLTTTCYDMIVNRQRTLWERKTEQNDFLTVRIGIGQVPFDANISYQVEDFTMDDDNLKKELDSLIEKYRTLNNVPIGYSFAKNNITAINGVFPKYIFAVKNYLLQLMAYHSYDDLKIAVFTNKSNAERWEYMKKMPYSFSNDKQIRFFAVNTEEMQDVSNYLSQIFDYRKSIFDESSNGKIGYSSFKGYYLILIDDIDMARKIGIVEDVLESKINLGFSLLILEDKLSKIPSECNNFIVIGNKTSGILNSESDDNQIKFKDEIINNFNMENCVLSLSNLPIYFDTKENTMPSMVTFLELFGVGQVEQLNSINRWRDNNPTKSLKAPVGVNENGDPFILDIHEKYHGPHGLVAGMTGSGKSEFIITYILSMAINYSPEEVAFVLIDYKGGGLTGAFEDPETGMKLPHIVGTITNLDKAEINRALSSINSELRRRQKIFNKAREIHGESTVDIYKYQRMYREGIVEEPMPHLIIISDEFAELKAQQPDFMDDLISTARIGRSLGVHLILATQKPSGVVDAQIWSNSKFKICLKVQDKADSMEMIKCANAAELKEVGRFYLSVGYNEYFALGQAAWAGAPYYPSKEYKKPVDKKIYFINNVGFPIKSIDNTISKRNFKADGEELSAILKYIINVSSNFNLKIRKLWLDKIPHNIYFSKLIKKYKYVKQNYVLNPIIGEYDNPFDQKQSLLTLPITAEGNLLVYGMGDSGKDEFLQSLLYSLISTYSTDEINIYALDFGAETLLNFSDAPQVGNVIINGDDEKIENLLKMLYSEMNKRKKMFMSYNGNYIDYIKYSGLKIPNIVVLINLVEVMTEIYEKYTNQFINIIREGSKYGIYFAVTTTNQNSIRFKMSQCFKQVLCLQMINESEYKDILGKTNGLLPTSCLGRGLVKLDRVCEFQTAFIDTEEKKYSTIKQTVDSLLNNGMEKAKLIPMMPEIIELNLFAKRYRGIDSIPLGIYKENLSFCLYDFSKNVVNLISSSDFECMTNFILNFANVLNKNNSFNKIILDAEHLFEGMDNNFYVNNNFEKILDSLSLIDKDNFKIFTESNMSYKVIENKANTLCIIIGLEKFIDKLDSQHKNIFKEILEHNKDMSKINFVFIDIPAGFKKFEYEAWYKESVDNNDGLWIGSGITQQYVLKSLTQSVEMSKISNDFGIVLKNGMPYVIKFINEYKKLKT